jgi:hypothetical protein
MQHMEVSGVLRNTWQRVNILWLHTEEAQICMPSHSQRIWAEVSSSAPHFPHNGLSINLNKRRYLLRVLCPVRRPVTALDCILLHNRCLALVPRQGPEINSQAYLWVTMYIMESKTEIDL